MSTACSRFRRILLVRRWLPLVALCIVACAAAAHATAAPTRSLATCSGSHLAGRVTGSSGAAGTISLAIRLRNVSNRACTMTGYPRLRIVDGTTRLPTRVTHGGLAFLERPVRRVRLAPGGVASILLAYEDVPVGNETSCRSGTALLVRPPGSALAVRVKASTTACGRGHLWTSPVLAGRVGVGG
jgi:hypothetical protein